MKQVPRLQTDEEAEAFLDQDLSDLDFSQFQPASIHLAPKMARLNMRMPEQAVAALKKRAEAQGVSFSRYMRELIERELART